MPDDHRDAQSPATPQAMPIGPDHQLPPPKRSTSLRIVVWLVMLLAFALLFWWILTHKQDAPATGGGGGGRRGGGAGGGTVTVSVETAKQGDIPVYLDAIGTVTPVYTTQVVSQVTGMVSAVLYREGQTVHRGQKLIQIDPRPYAATVATAQGQLERDTNLLAQAQMDLQRYQNAWAKNAIPKQTLDDQEKIVLQEQGTVKADQGTLQYDQVQLGFTNITAPITGRAGLRLVDPGNLATANSSTPLVVLTQLQPITVVFTIPEDNVTQLQAQTKRGEQLEVDALDRSEQTRIATGKLTSTDNQIDTTTGTLKLRATFANKNEGLFPNQFVNARLLLQTLHNVVLVPSSAIQHNGDQVYVFLLENGVAHIQPVKPGVSEGSETEITSGLKAGDVIADSSFEKLTDGGKITISKQKLLPANDESNAP